MFYLLLLVPAFIPALIFAGSFCGFKNPTLDFALTMLSGFTCSRIIGSKVAVCVLGTATV